MIKLEKHDPIRISPTTFPSKWPPNPHWARFSAQHLPLFHLQQRVTSDLQRTKHSSVYLRDKKRRKNLPPKNTVKTRFYWARFVYLTLSRGEVILFMYARVLYKYIVYSIYIVYKRKRKTISPWRNNYSMFIR
jgi:hypothetical protein